MVVSAAAELPRAGADVVLDMMPQQQQERREKEAAAPMGAVRCWGCAKLVMPPDGATIFKCGYCGAISEEERGPRARKVKVLEGERGAPRSCTQRLGDAADAAGDFAEQMCDCCGRACARSPLPMRRFLGMVMLPLVLFLISSIILLGVCKIYPVFLPRPPSLVYAAHWTLCVTLSFNTLFNYLLACVGDPGYVHRIPFGSVEEVPRLGLENYFYCARCKAPKPPSAHHCSTSGRCVVDLDHYCPFINNAVGALNRRHFVLFLAWAVASVGYVFTLTMLLVYRHREQFTWEALQAMLFGPIYLPYGGPWRVIQYSLQQSVAPPMEGTVPRVALIYEAVACFTVLALVGILLCQQLSYVSSGETYIGMLKAEAAGRDPYATLSWAQRMENFRLVFGSAPMWTWPLPLIGQPQGAAAKAHKQN